MEQTTRISDDDYIDSELAHTLRAIKEALKTSEDEDNQSKLDHLWAHHIDEHDTRGEVER